MNAVTERRLGTFWIDGIRLHYQVEAEEAQMVLATCIVVECRYSYADAQLHYTAYSPHFRAVPPGGAIPEYVPCIRRDEPLGQKTVFWR